MTKLYKAVSDRERKHICYISKQTEWYNFAREQTDDTTYLTLWTFIKCVPEANQGIKICILINVFNYLFMDEYLNFCQLEEVML